MPCPPKLPCPDVSTPSCFRARRSLYPSHSPGLFPICHHAHLSPCPEGTRLGEANVHNRGCGSRRETYLRIKAPPTPPPEGRYFTTWTREDLGMRFHLIVRVFSLICHSARRAHLLPTAPLPGCAFLRYAEHTHPPSPGSQTPGTIHPMIPHDPVGVASTHPINQSAPICVICGSRFFFVRALLSQHPSHCPGLFPVGIRAHLSPSPEGARLGEANVHNRGCGSRRETYLRRIPPTHAPA
jgi:hypothetical protein